jgi:hypothetical protein
MLALEPAAKTSSSLTIGFLIVGDEACTKKENLQNSNNY